jgi:hypothetical protein
MPSIPDSVSRRPWSLWIFSLIVAGIGVYNLALALDQVRHAGYYRMLGVSYPPLLRAVTALAWGMILLALGSGLARRQRWSRRWTLLILSNYGAFSVLWLVVFARSDFGRGRIVFQAALTAILVALAGWVIHWRRIRAAFVYPAEPETPSGELVE